MLTGVPRGLAEVPPSTGMELVSSPLAAKLAEKLRARDDKEKEIADKLEKRLPPGGADAGKQASHW